MSEDLKKLRVECDCCNIEHLMEFMYDDEQRSDFPLDNMLYVTHELNSGVPFFVRLKYAFIYLFRLFPYRYSHFGETILKPHSARDLLQFLQKYMDYIERKNLFD
jgi:hypothetical protein